MGFKDALTLTLSRPTGGGTAVERLVILGNHFAGHRVLVVQSKRCAME
jgi:hypothetical protein